MEGSLTLRILREVMEAPLSPGDVAARLGAPRYRVLASFHILEELGLVERVYSKGSYKVYAATELGKAVLALASEGASLRDIVERGVEALVSGGGQPSAEAGEASVEA
jgi:DNA-binding IclR family transcriptional regulator